MRQNIWYVVEHLMSDRTFGDRAFKWHEYLVRIRGYLVSSNIFEKLIIVLGKRNYSFIENIVNCLRWGKQ